MCSNSNLCTSPNLVTYFHWMDVLDSIAVVHATSELLLYCVVICLAVL